MYLKNIHSLIILSMNNGQIIDFFITGIILLMILNTSPQYFWLDDEKKKQIIKATEIKQKILT